MSHFFDAFEVSPVPTPGPDARPPEPFRGIYGMPMFITLACADLAGSTRFWVEALGFFELFSVPGRLVHLRRWAFQDVLLVPGGDESGRRGPAQPVPSFACVLSELDPLASACRDAGAEVTGPEDTPWNTRDLAVETPEGVRVVFTAAKPWDAGSPQAHNLASIGITPPEAD